MAVLIAALGLLGYWCIIFPQFRVICIIGMADIVFGFFKLWRFLPWEWMHVRNVATRVAELRVGGAKNYMELNNFARAGLPLEA